MHICFQYFFWKKDFTETEKERCKEMKKHQIPIIWKKWFLKKSISDSCGSFKCMGYEAFASWVKRRTKHHLQIDHPLNLLFLNEKNKNKKITEKKVAFATTRFVKIKIPSITGYELRNLCALSWKLILQGPQVVLIRNFLSFVGMVFWQTDSCFLCKVYLLSPCRYWNIIYTYPKSIRIYETLEWKST